LTGAGISTESGIPDFRGPDGLWRKVNPEIATYSFFIKNSEKFWEFHLNFVKKFKEVKPNNAHYALVELEKMGFLKCIITQNIDGLHQAAGSKNVIELHGNLRTVSCISCGRKYRYEDVYMLIEQCGLPPKCIECSGVLKPDVVLFEEPLPYEAIMTAYTEAYKSDLILVLGSSLSVYPAATIPDIVKSNYGKVIIINLQNTEKDHLGDIVIYGRLGDILPKIVEQVKLNYK